MNMFEAIGRILIGSKEFRVEEQRREEEATWHGQTYDARVGGLLGMLNKLRANEASRLKGGRSSRGS